MLQGNGVRKECCSELVSLSFLQTLETHSRVHFHNLLISLNLGSGFFFFTSQTHLTSPRRGVSLCVNILLKEIIQITNAHPPRLIRCIRSIVSLLCIYIYIRSVSCFQSVCLCVRVCVLFLACYSIGSKELFALVCLTVWWKGGGGNKGIGCP